MQYTLAQACREISTSTHAYGTADAKAAVNRAIQALAGLSGWECLRRVVRIFSAQPVFALPQGCAGLVRACVGGRPVTVRGQDFQFLHSGPGDLSRPPCGFCHVPPENIIDRDMSPLVFTPRAPFKLYAVSDVEGEPPIRVKGSLPDGTIVRETVTVHPTPDGVPFDPLSYEPAGYGYLNVYEVVLDDAAAHYVDLWCSCPDGKFRIARYHPEVKVPSFRHYEIQGMRPGGCEILAEVRIDPLPLVEDSDVVPFDTLEPIEWMIQMRWYMKSNEIDAAQKIAQIATQWLRAREATAAKVQTAVISNSLYRGSLGELSAEAVNI